ncbi:MAG: T9SS C-terminal target domain-containing protein, partial [Calditrichaeota bacterium]
HRVVFNAGHLPAGIYLYRLSAGAFQQWRKMALVK